MASFKKILLASFLSASLIVLPIQSARAFFPLIVIPWLLVGSNLLITDLVVGQVGVLTALMWWDCNKFSLSAPCTTKTPIPSAQLPKPALTVNLQPDAKRENPNPQKFNDPSASSGSPRDVTPKAQIAAGGTPPPPAPQGPINTGIYQQSAMSTETGPTSDDTFQAQYQQSNANGDALIAGVITVKQMFAPTRAFPYVAKSVTCTYPATGDQQPALTACDAKNTEARNAVQAYNDPSRYYYSKGGLAPQASGVLRYVHVVIFYDQAADVAVTCDAGYSPSSSDPSKCDLTNASAVKKPADTPCEMLFDPSSKQIMTDPANPGCDGLATSANLSVPASQGQSGIDVKANAGNGFDVCINKPDKGKTCFDTGVYDPGTGGYVIVHTTITPPPDPNNGLGCGGPGQSVCSMVANSNADMQQKDADSRTSIDQANTGLKGKMDNIDPNKFQWSFIPQIPTTACVNPSVRNPVTGGPVEMDICGGFNKFTFFLNAVLAIACVYGCVKQVQNAMKA